MVDYLEDSVDEKYYIDNEKSSALIKKLIDNGTLSEESVTEWQKVQELSRSTAALNYRRIDKVNLLVAKTLCARDYKGFGTGFDTMNGVIEWNYKIFCSQRESPVRTRPNYQHETLCRTRQVYQDLEDVLPKEHFKH